MWPVCSRSALWAFRSTQRPADAGRRPAACGCWGRLLPVCVVWAAEAGGRDGVCCVNVWAVEVWVGVDGAEGVAAQGGSNCSSSHAMLPRWPIPPCSYSADITTTFPVNGRFSRRQRLVYDAVLAASRGVIAAMKPGVRWPVRRPALRAATCLRDRTPAARAFTPVRSDRRLLPADQLPRFTCPGQQRVSTLATGCPVAS